MPEVPVAPAVEPFKEVQAGVNAGKRVAPATAGQLGMFGLQEAGGVEVQGSSPGPGQEPAEHWICNNEMFGGAVQPGPVTRIPYAKLAVGENVTVESPPGTPQPSSSYAYTTVPAALVIVISES